MKSLRNLFLAILSLLPRKSPNFFASSSPFLSKSVSMITLSSSHIDAHSSKLLPVSVSIFLNPSNVSTALSFFPSTITVREVKVQRYSKSSFSSSVSMIFISIYPPCNIASHFFEATDRGRAKIIFFFRFLNLSPG